MAYRIAEAASGREPGHQTGTLLTTDPDRTMAGMRATAAGGIVVAAASASGVQTTLLILGAVVFAVASWRRDTRSVLRQQNLDLSDRNLTLEKDLDRSKALIDSLNSRPNLDQHAATLTDLIERLANHDRVQGERDEKLLAAVVELGKNVHANTTALGFWIGNKERDLD